MRIRHRTLSRPKSCPGHQKYSRAGYCFSITLATASFHTPVFRQRLGRRRRTTSPGHRVGSTTLRVTPYQATAHSPWLAIFQSAKHNLPGPQRCRIRLARRFMSPSRRTECCSPEYCPASSNRPSVAHRSGGCRCSWRRKQRLTGLIPVSPVTVSAMPVTETIFPAIRPPAALQA